MDNYLPIGEIVQGLAIPLGFIVAVVMSLVEYSKKFGAGGRVCDALSMTFGVLLGSGYYIASFGVPEDFAHAFIMFFVAVVPGLMASGVYNLAKK